MGEAFLTPNPTLVGRVLTQCPCRSQALRVRGWPGAAEVPPTAEQARHSERDVPLLQLACVGGRPVHQTQRRQRNGVDRIRQNQTHSAQERMPGAWRESRASSLDWIEMRQRKSWSDVNQFLSLVLFSSTFWYSMLPGDNCQNNAFIRKRALKTRSVVDTSSEIRSPNTVFLFHLFVCLLLLLLFAGKG